MSPFFIAAIVIGYIIYFVVKSTAQKQQRRGQTNNKSGNSSEKFFDIIAEALGGEKTVGQSTKAKQQAPARDNPQDINNPFETGPEIGDEEGHFSEAELVREFKEAHSKGKPLKHHVHDYFDEEKDRKVSRMRARRKAVHPVMRTLRNPRTFKHAIVVSEVLKRKF